MREKDYYGAIKGFCLKWNLPEVWNSDRITGANLIYEVIKVINAMIVEQKAMKEMIEEFLLMFNEDLNDTVKEQLTVWLNDGTLGDVINETLFNSKVDNSEFDSYKDQQTLIDQSQNQHLNNIDNNIVNINVKTSVNDRNGAHNLIYGNGTRNFLHRGLSFYLPENSFWALDMAGFLGGSGLEIDLWKSIDDVFIVSHDDSLLSMTDSNLNISQTSSNVILNQNITKGKGVTRVPISKMLRFESAIDIALKYGIPIIAEIKPTNLTSDELRILVDIIESKNCADLIALMSFDFETIRKIREISSEIIIGLVVTADYYNQTNIDLLNSLGRSFASVNFNSVSQATAHQKLSNDNNIPITFWTINDVPTSQVLVRNGIKSITSDRIKGFKPTQISKSFMISKKEGVLVIENDFMPEFAYITINNPSNYTLYFVSPFLINDTAPDQRRGIAQVAMGGATVGDFYVRASGERNNNITLELFNSLGQKISFDLLPNGSWFNIIINGYDFL